MTEVAFRTEPTTKSKKAGAADFQFPQFEMPKMEIPGSLRDAAAKWFDQGRENFEKAIHTAEEINGTFEKACSAAAKGAADYGVKVTDGVHTNTVAAFDLARDILAAKSLPEVMELSSAGARKQFDVVAAKNQELWALTQQVMIETIKPIAGYVPKAFNVGVST